MQDGLHSLFHRATGACAVGGVVAFTFAVLTSCTTPAPSARVQKPDSAPRASERGRAWVELEEARRMVEAGDFTTVIPRLLQIIANYPNTDAATEAHYWLGVSYYKIQGYQDSITVFREYLRAAPNGQYADAAASYIEQQRTEYKGKYRTPDEVNDEIDALLVELKAGPADPDKQVKLAGLFWEIGDYVNAGRLYEAVLRKHPERESESPIRERIERIPGNGYILLTPAEIQRRERENNPIEVMNVNSFRSGRDIFTREQLFYSVTGQVKNQSNSQLYGVQIIVTIYGLGNVVYDTQTVNIGRLNPSEVRAFSVRFANFDNLENVQRHECVATFQQ